MNAYWKIVSKIGMPVAGLGVDLSIKPMMDLKNNGSNPTMLGQQANMVKQLTRVIMAAKYAGSLKDLNGAACNATGTSTPQQIACTVNAMASVMTGAATTDPTKVATVLAALNAQTVTTSLHAHHQGGWNARHAHAIG